jgi:hypothetical protein
LSDGPHAQRRSGRGRFTAETQRRGLGFLGVSASLRFTDFERWTPCPAGTPARRKKIHHRATEDTEKEFIRETISNPPCHPGESRGPYTRASGIWAPAFAGVTRERWRPRGSNFERRTPCPAETATRGYGIHAEARRRGAGFRGGTQDRAIDPMSSGAEAASSGAGIPAGRRKSVHGEQNKVTHRSGIRT